MCYIKFVHIIRALYLLYRTQRYILHIYIPILNCQMHCEYIIHIYVTQLCTNIVKYI